MNNQRKQLVNTIYDALKKGSISKGNKLLSERELAEKFMVTRAAIREALISLEALGVVEIRDRQGVFIGKEEVEHFIRGIDLLHSTSPIDLFSQIYEVRTMIEPHAAELAATRRNERDISLLLEEIEFFKYLEKTNHKEKGPLGSQHNMILHNLIITAAHNALLCRIYEGLSKLSQNSIIVMGDNNPTFHPYAKWPEILSKEHSDIVEAIIESNPAKARETMMLHLENSRFRNHNIKSLHFPSS